MDTKSPHQPSRPGIYLYIQGCCSTNPYQTPPSLYRSASSYYVHLTSSTHTSRDDAEPQPLSGGDAAPPRAAGPPTGDAQGHHQGGPTGQEAAAGDHLRGVTQSRARATQRVQVRRAAPHRCSTGAVIIVIVHALLISIPATATATVPGEFPVVDDGTGCGLLSAAC